ncbi:Protein of unknown function [Marinobacter segnicrescens]|uniref:Oxalurate catabolism protein HpxZ n=1 Tax=Marinobacter segnicrescens TaxID=430453 RepID=A0A1H9YTP1_9GAMM|nr:MULTISPECIES: oxalurate catabolism protein HpxZ [Marinobacter]UZD64407.1 oxalurate catabolism protein HpxZ [Marinobacter sp. AN1]SES72493.1 Protein of unknown function [Marinobacter segnicrescens]
MEINLPDVVAEVTAVFEQYEKALIENDVEVLDGLFWNDPRVVRYGAGENLYGYDQIAEFRKSRPSKGLERTLRNTVITTHGTDLATVWTEFLRPGVNRVGRQSQVWTRQPEGWRVVAAHVSFMDA